MILEIKNFNEKVHNKCQQMEKKKAWSSDSPDLFWWDILIQIKCKSTNWVKAESLFSICCWYYMVVLSRISRLKPTTT